MSAYKLRIINHRIKLYADDPISVEENSPHETFNWRCDIWEQERDWPLFATAWGRTRIEARAKANSIIQACGRDYFETVGG